MSKRRYCCGFEEYSVDSYLFLAVSPGIICRHSRDLVAADESTEDTSHCKGSPFSTSVLMLSRSLLQTLEKWKSVTFPEETQIVFDHDRNIYVSRKPDEVWLSEGFGKAIVVHEYLLRLEDA